MDNADQLFYYRQIVEKYMGPVCLRQVVASLSGSAMNAPQDQADGWWYHSLMAHLHQKGHTVPKQIIMIATSIQVATV